MWGWDSSVHQDGHIELIGFVSTRLVRKAAIEGHVVNPMFVISHITKDGVAEVPFTNVVFGVFPQLLASDMFGLTTRQWRLLSTTPPYWCLGDIGGSDGEREPRVADLA